jgi:hypothetical protein
MIFEIPLVDPGIETPGTPPSHRWPVTFPVVAAVAVKLTTHDSLAASPLPAVIAAMPVSPVTAAPVLPPPPGWIIVIVPVCPAVNPASVELVTLVATSVQSKACTVLLVAVNVAEAAEQVGVA